MDNGNLEADVPSDFISLDLSQQINNLNKK